MSRTTIEVNNSNQSDFIDNEDINEVVDKYRAVLRIKKYEGDFRGEWLSLTAVCIKEIRKIEV